MLKDLNYFPLDVESNIYGMTTLQFEDRTNKVLVATLDCRIYCINYNRFKPQTKEVEFTYIPTGAKIISIGALKRGPNDFVIGITHSMALSVTTKGTTAREFVMDSYTNRQTTYYFNIYANESVLPNFDLDQVAQGCQTLRLKYVPYHLYSTELIKLTSNSSSSNKQVKRIPFWLLSGGDNGLHAFFEDEICQSFNEVPIEEYLPELSQKHSLILWIDVANINRSKPSKIFFERVVALGYEDGTVRLLQSVMEEVTGLFILTKESCFDRYSTIIPSVRLFQTSSVNKKNLPLRQIIKSQNSLHDVQEDDPLNLLVIGSTYPSLIFRDVLKNGLEDSQELPESQRLDCSTTSSIGDTNTDGFSEILIGTHGKELLTYQYNPSEDRYLLKHINKFNHPIFALTVIDLTGDVLKDVIILLANGVLVMQSSTIKDVIETCKRRIRASLKIIDTR